MLAILGLAQLMVVLDGTIVNIALPSAQQSLAFSDESRQWIVTAYALSFGSFLLLGGKIGDLFGRKLTFIAGLIGFAVVSAVGGAAQNFETLVAARALQGVFGAMLAPAALSLLTTTFTVPAERAKAFGIFGAIAGSGAAAGLLLGGLLTEYLNWRFCLYVNLAIAVPAAAGAWALLHNQPHPSRPRLDFPGAITASAGLFSLVYGFSHAETTSWANTLTIVALAASVVFLSVFAWLQTRVEHPLLPLRVVLDRNRGGAYLAVAIAGAGMFGVFLFLTYYLQLTRGMSPIMTGLAFMPMVAAIMVSATTATAKLVPRFGPRPLITAGMLIAAGGLVLLTGVGVDTAYASHVLPGLILTGVGMGWIMAPAMNTATSGIDRADAGVASAMVNTGQQIGGSIGTALLSTIVSSAVASYLASHTQSAAGAAADQAAVHGYTVAFWWSAGIFLVGSVICGLLIRPGVPQLDPAAEPAIAH